MKDAAYDAERLDIDFTTDNLFIALMKEEGLYRYALAQRILAGRFDRPITVLDAACGYGYGSKVFGTEDTYIGIDISKQAVEQARATYPGADFRAGDLSDAATYADVPECDAILSFETIEHVEAPSVFLAQCRSVLGTGDGLLFLSAPTVLTRDWTPFHLHDRSARGWRRTLQRAGFEVFAEVSQGFTIPFQSFASVRPANDAAAAKGAGGLKELIENNWDVARFLLVHPRYLLLRAYDWFLRKRFRWESRLYLCRVKPRSGA